MARTVKLYNCTIDSRYLNKSDGLTQIGNDLNCNFKDDTELVNPVLILSTYTENINYVYIPSLYRYYFVTGVTYSEGYYYVALHVDVLYSFMQSILDQECILARASEEGKYNLFQSDDKFKLYEYTQVRYKLFKGGTSFDPSIQNFVLCVMGADEPENNGGGA